MILKGISILPKIRTSKGYNGSKDSFYQTKQWKDFRQQYLSQYPLCKICTEQGRTNEATVLDHIQPIKQGGAIWAQYNLQGLCKSCNAKKTALDNPNNYDTHPTNKGNNQGNTI